MNLMRISQSILRTASACAFLLAAPAAFAQKGGGSTDTPEKNAVYGSCQIYWTNVNGNKSCALYEVPAGKRLVLQHGSMYCTSLNGYAVGNAYIGGMLGGTAWQPNAHFIPLVTLPTPMNLTEVRQAGGGPMTGYADPGAPVLANGWGSNGSFCQASMSGYLVSMQ